MQQALQTALQRANEANANRIHSIRLRIGAVSGVVPEALRFAFEVITPGTPAEGATLVIDEVPAVFACAECATKIPFEDNAGCCPSCHGTRLDLQSGREMELTSLEIE